MTTAVLEKNTESQTKSDREFSFHDRCDKCGFQAYVVAQLASCEADLELTFCGHHGRENALGLVSDGWHVLDFTHMINEKPSPSASDLD
jgi:ribosomal protein L37E